MTPRISALEPYRIARALGCPKPEQALITQIEEAAAELLRTVRPRLVWRRLPLDAKTQFLVVGEDLRRLLAPCDDAVVLATTLGAETERYLRRAQLSGMAHAVVLDACADSAIEAVCDNFCADLAQAVAPSYLTDRFSPGYGDLPLSYQTILFQTLDITRRIGVTLTQSGQMLPQKSVTAILGIAKMPQPRRASGCENCNMRRNGTCQRGRTSCG